MAMFICQRNPNKIMRLKHIILMVFGLVLISIFVSGCVETKQYNLDTINGVKEKATPIPMSDIALLVTEIKEKSVSIPSNDLDFLEWSVVKFDNLFLYTELILNSTMSDKATYGNQIYNDSDKALSEIDKYQVSPEIQEIKDEFKASLENYRMFGYYTSKGARESNSDDRTLGINFWQLALGNWSKGIRLLEQYKNNGNIKPTIAPTAKPLTLYEWTVKEFTQNQNKNLPTKYDREFSAIQVQLRLEARTFEGAYLSISDMNVNYQEIKDSLENINNRNIIRLEEVSKINPNSSIVQSIEKLIKAGDIAKQKLEIRGNSENIEWKSNVPPDFNDKFGNYFSNGFRELETGLLGALEK